MQKREKILAAGLAGVVVLWLGLPWLESRFVQPLRELETREGALMEESDTLHEQQLDQARKEAQLKRWQAESLPPDPLDAQRLYQEWLTNLAQLCGFDVVKITLDRRSSEGNTYVTIPVTIEAKARLQELMQFLERFESANLLHRVSRCQVVSPANEGDPELGVTLTAEGLSLRAAAPRARLFPQTELDEPLAKDQRSLRVRSATGFPDKTPFLIRIGNEFLNVTRMNGTEWSVQRGVEKTFGATHESASVVELFPIQTGKDSSKVATVLWSQSLFVKPAPQTEYVPKLVSTQPPPAIRGRTWNWKLEVQGWNPAFGAPQYELISGPQGVDLDARTGSLRWSVREDAELGNRLLEVLVWGRNGYQAGFTTSISLRVRDPNLKPVFEISTPVRFFIGRESKWKVSAKDPDGDSSKLTFALAEGPAGMKIDPATGELSWKPAGDLMPQELQIKIEVKDSDDMPETATVQVPVILEEDSARFTYLTGSVVRTSGKQEAWFYDRITDRSMVAHTGDELRIADFDLRIEKIGPTYVDVRYQDALYRWEFEKPLAEIEPLPQPKTLVP